MRKLTNTQHKIVRNKSILEHTHYVIENRYQKIGEIALLKNINTLVMKRGI